MAMQELPEPARSDGEIGLEQSLELQKGLLVEDDRIKLRKAVLPSLKQYSTAFFGNDGVVLAPREPLLLGRGHHPPIDHQGSGAVVIVGRNTEDTHEPLGGTLRLKDRVDEGRHRGAFAQHDEASEQHHRAPRLESASTSCAPA